MMKRAFLRPLTLSLSLSLAAIGNVNASEYTTLDADASSITFDYRQMNVKMNGELTQLKATELSFDPKQPENAKVSIEVALSSINTGNAEANKELAKEEWLALKQYPIATFNSKQIKALGDNNYELQGELAIKGHQQLISVPFNFSEDGDTGIGEGQWKSSSIVANDINVTFHLLAK